MTGRIIEIVYCKSKIIETILWTVWIYKKGKR